MIVKNEAEVLGRCLESVRGLVTECVVVDTGSTDETVAIARRHGARVLTTTWQDDFSLARNLGLAAAQTPWILVLDADEVLEPGASDALRAAIEGQHGGYLLPLENMTGSGTDHERQTVMLLRLFRNDSRIRYRGRVHEQVTAGLAEAGYTIGTATARIRHDGYLASRVSARDKHARNLSLLQATLADSPEDPYAWYQLAKTYLAMDRRDEGRGALDACLELLSGQAEPETFAYYPKGFVLRGLLAEPADRLDLLARGLERLPDSAELHLQAGLAHREAGSLEAARRHLERASDPAAFAPGVEPGEIAGRAALALGEIAAQQGDGVGAIAHYRAAATLRPRELAPWLRLAGASMERGDLGGAIAAYQAVVRIDPAEFSAQLALGTLYFETGDLGSALAALLAADHLRPGLSDLRALIQACRALGANG